MPDGRTRLLAAILCGGLVAVPGVAGAQSLPIPGLSDFAGDESKGPSFRLASDEREQLSRERRALLDRQQGLLVESQDADEWKQRRDAAKARVEELIKRRDATAPETAPDAAPDSAPDSATDAAPAPDTEPAAAPEEPAAPALPPEERAEIDRLVEALRALIRAYDTALRLLGEERSLITSGVSRAESLLQQMEQRSEDAAGKDVYSLRKVLSISLKVHLARIDRSLASARVRQPSSLDEESLRGTTLAPLPPLDADADADDGPGPGAAWRRLSLLREENEAARTRLRDLAPRTRALATRTDDARSRLARIQLTAARFEVSERERELEHALDRIVVKPSELESTEGRYQRSIERRRKARERLDAELDRIRASAPAAAPGDDADAVTPARVAQVQRTLVSERLALERAKLARDRFRRDLARALTEMVRGVRPSDAFFDTNRALLDADEMKRRQTDLESRCDGWRRANSSVTRREVAPDLDEAKTALLEAYGGLADACMRGEWVLGTQVRLGDIARYHIRRLEWAGRSVDWYIWRVLVTLLTAFAAVVTSRWISRVTRRLAGHTDDEDSAGPRHRPAKWRTLLGLLCYLAGIALVWGGAVALVLQLLWGIPVDWSAAMAWATHPLFVVGDNDISVASLVKILLWLFAAVWLGRLTQGFISNQLLQHFAIERGVRDAAGTVARYVVILAGVGVGLASAGVGFGALAVVFGVLGIGIGFGLQNIADNFISGFIILLERPIRKGDFVQVGEMVGLVTQINARSTTIETRDSVAVIVPNSEFISAQVINWTHGESAHVRTQVRVGVAYGSDLADVEKRLLEVAAAHPAVLRSPPPEVELENFGESSVDFVVHVWTRHVRQLPRLQSDLNKAIAAAFDEAGIEIPFPQRVVQISGGADDDEGDGGDEGDEGDE